MNGTAFLSYVQLLDSALPIGGFAHSFGLETYVQRGLVTNPAQLEAYIRGQIRHSLVRLDGPAVKGICRAIADHDMWRVALIDKIVHVQRVPRESREGLHQMGRRLLELGKKLYPDFALTRLEEALQRYGAYGTLPTVHAWISCKLGVDRDAAAKGYLYTGIAAMVNCGQRLMAVGQTDAQLILRRMLGELEREWEAAGHLAPEEMHTFATAHEIRAMQHETLYSRLFMS